MPVIVHLATSANGRLGASCKSVNPGIIYSFTSRITFGIVSGINKETEMPIEISAGPLAGHMIRKARKPGRCADYRHCHTIIRPGDLYAEGDVDPYTAGGFANERLCLECAGPDARAAAAR